MVLRYARSSNVFAKGDEFLKQKLDEGESEGRVGAREQEVDYSQNQK